MKFRSPGLSKHSIIAPTAPTRDSAGELFCKGTAVSLNLRFLLSNGPPLRHPHGFGLALKAWAGSCSSRASLSRRTSRRRGLGEAGRFCIAGGKVSVCVLAAAM